MGCAARGVPGSLSDVHAPLPPAPIKMLTTGPLAPPVLNFHAFSVKRCLSDLAPDSAMAAGDRGDSAAPSTSKVVRLLSP